MLTYDLTNVEGALYKYIYKCIKEDIVNGNIEPNEKMPSKRTLAKNLGVSTITVENAYDQLIGEGYMYAVPKKGYYLSEMIDINKVKVQKNISYHIRVPEKKIAKFDFSSNGTSTENFPFSIWAKVMREVLSSKEESLLKVSPSGGVLELRQAIANHLSSFRGMSVDPNQIIVGAGTEYLYELLIKLLGKDKLYCIENPGYKKIGQIYEKNNVKYKLANMDSQGIKLCEVKKTKAQIAHISPTHHFPTGITMPINRRYELLAWANENRERYIIEDDYDSEFRLNGSPIPPLFSIDACEKVIYINTFSKSLASTIRISYMVLPPHLANEFYDKLSFYACTVSTFEQYTLAEFIAQGYFERHINRMRLHYSRKRKMVIDIIRQNFDEKECSIIENDSGLHFLLELNTILSDEDVENKLMDNNIKIKSVADFDMQGNKTNTHQFILNYSNIDIDNLDKAMKIIKKKVLR